MTPAHDDDVSFAVQHLENGFSLLRLVTFEVEVELVVARSIRDRVEGDHDDPGLARLFDHAVDRGLGSGVDQQDIDLLENQFSDLTVLLSNGAVAIHDDVIGDLALAFRLLGGGLEGFDHLMAPSVAVVSVRKRNDRRLRRGRGWRERSQQRQSADGGDGKFHMLLPMKSVGLDGD